MLLGGIEAVLSGDMGLYIGMEMGYDVGMGRTMEHQCKFKLDKSMYTIIHTLSYDTLCYAIPNRPRCSKKGKLGRREEGG